MLKLLVYSLIAMAVFLIVSAPWVSAVVYFWNGIMQPKFVWPWTFPDIPYSRTMAIISILAWMKMIFSSEVDKGVYHHTLFHIFHWFCVLLWFKVSKLSNLCHFHSIFTDFH